WFEEYTSRDRLLAACLGKRNVTDEDVAETSIAKALSASSCVAEAARVLDDETLCPYAVYDRDRCYSALGIELTKEQKVVMCSDTSGVTDNVTIATCLWDLAKVEVDVNVCR
ncbi:MAG: hypothetical protein AABY13_00940, partial [Nanoarchaeota archaeon]